MAFLQIPTIATEQVTEIFQQLAIPEEILPSVLAFGLVFFLLSLIKLDIKLRFIVGAVASAGLVAINFLQIEQLASIVLPIQSMLSGFTTSLGQTGTLIASAGLIALGVVFGKLAGKALLRRIIKKAGEPTHALEHKLQHLEKERDHLIMELKHAKGNPVHELKIEKKINKVNEKINVLKAKLGLPITA